MNDALKEVTAYGGLKNIIRLSTFIDFKRIDLVGKCEESVVETVFDLNFEGHLIGEVVFSNLEESKISKPLLLDVLHQMACVTRAYLWKEEYFRYFLKVLTWVEKARSICPEKFNWIGVYFKETYLKQTDSTDLILGPYLGEWTEHTRIPIDRGLCGLALREERVINMADVTQDTRHIACSLKTKSELIVPLKDRSGEFVAELDIDSNQLNAFDKQLEEKVKEFCKTFPLIED